MRHVRVFCVGCKKVFHGCTCHACRYDVRYGMCEDCKEEETRKTEEKTKLVLIDKEDWVGIP